jgi:hypothetical protein
MDEQLPTAPRELGQEKQMFIVDNNTIEYITERQYGIRFCRETTTPYGVGSKLHRRGREVWCWGHQGSFPRCVRECQTVAEAEKELIEMKIFEAHHREAAPYLHHTLASAARDVAENLLYGDYADADLIEDVLSQQSVRARRAIRAEMRKLNG